MGAFAILADHRHGAAFQVDPDHLTGTTFLNSATKSDRSVMMPLGAKPNSFLARSMEIGGNTTLGARSSTSMVRGTRRDRPSSNSPWLTLRPPAILYSRAFPDRAMRGNTATRSAMPT